MQKAISVIIFAVIVISVVGVVVMIAGNNQPTPIVKINSSIGSGTGQTSNSTGTSNSGVSRAELSKHSTQSDCWVSYKGKVYDLTAWLPKHPGSARAIAPFCGTAEEFENAFAGQHGTSQVNRLTKEGVYKGDLA